MWLIDSSVGRKFIMGITGVFLVFFLLFHSLMNAVVLFSPDAYDAICEFLGANWYALIASLVLAGGVVVHVLYAMLLTVQNLRARGNVRYEVTARQEGVSWSSKNMLVLGVLIFGFLGLHLVQFWAKMQLVELTHVGDVELAAKGSHWIKYYFYDFPVYSVLYILLMVPLWLHLTHGVWSSMHSMGLSNKVWLPRLKFIANIISTIVVLLFVAVPAYYLFLKIIGATV